MPAHQGELLKKPDCYRKLRENVIFRQARMSPVADLGFGVLDTAMVETVAFVLEKGWPITEVKHGKACNFRGSAGSGEAAFAIG